MRKSVEERAYLKALDEEVKAVVIVVAKARDYEWGFLEAVVHELGEGWNVKKLSRVLNRHAHLKKWWPKFKEEARKHRARKRKARYVQNLQARFRAQIEDPQ